MDFEAEAKELIRQIRYHYIDGVSVADAADALPPSVRDIAGRGGR